MGHRAKEGLIIEFIQHTDLNSIPDKPSLLAAFYEFTQEKQKQEAKELIEENKLNPEAAQRYLIASLKREYASENGTDLNNALPKISPLHPQYLTLKQSIFQKIAAFVEKFKGIGGLTH